MTAAQSLRAKFFKVLATVNELKIIIFVLNYVTVLSYTKTLHQNGWINIYLTALQLGK